jgi:hypothetical protein
MTGARRDEAFPKIADVLIGTKQAGGDGYLWQHFRAPDGKVFELVSDPSHP